MRQTGSIRSKAPLFCVLAFSGLLWGVAAHAQSERSISVEQLPVVQLEAPASELHVDIWANRTDGQYLPGESVELYIRANRDVRVSVLNVDALGRTTVLLPNAYTTDNHLQGNTVYSLPAPGANFRLQVNEPFGSNLIKVVATTGAHPILDATALHRVDGPFAQFTGTTQQLVRSVQVVMSEQTQSEWAVADLFIDVVRSRAEAAVPSAAPAVSSPADRFELQMQTDRPEYRLGDRMTVTLTAERDCSLTLVNIEQAQNSATVLYPNRVIETVRLRAGQPTALPGADSALQLAVLGPAGPQTLVAVCTEDSRPALVDVSGLPLRAVYPVLSAGQWSALQQTVQHQPRTGRASLVFQVQP